jgi:hypothetical protein
VVVALAALLVIVRIYFKVRSAARGTRRAGWDEQEIGRLRKQGYAPFKEYPVDFFLALPDTDACQVARGQLEPLGYTMDVKSLEDGETLRCSLHASRTMRLIVPDMEAETRRLTALAEQLHGRYDGWAAGPLASQAVPLFMVEPVHLGAPLPGLSHDRVSALLEGVEGAQHP